MDALHHDTMDEMMISEVLDSLDVNTAQHASSPCDIPYPQGGGGGGGAHGGGSDFLGGHEVSSNSHHHNSHHDSHHHNSHHNHHHNHHHDKTAPNDLNDPIMTVQHASDLHSLGDHFPVNSFSNDHTFTVDQSGHQHHQQHQQHQAAVHGHHPPLGTAASAALELSGSDVIPLHCDTDDLDNELPLSSLIYYSTLDVADNGLDFLLVSLANSTFNFSIWSC